MKKQKKSTQNEFFQMKSDVMGFLITRIFGPQKIYVLENHVTRVFFGNYYLLTIGLLNSIIFVDLSTLNPDPNSIFQFNVQELYNSKLKNIYLKTTFFNHTFLRKHGNFLLM